MRTWILVTLIVAATVISSDRVSAAPPGCAGKQFRGFDYMVGMWIGRNAKGEVRGKSEVTSVLAGCSIRMHWTGRTFEGTNNNTYDATRNLWQKAWFDNTGGVELSEGRLIHGAIVYLGYDYENGKPVEMHREAWIPLADGRVQEHYEISKNHGHTWQRVFDTFYTRVDRRTFDATKIIQEQ